MKRSNRLLILLGILLAITGAGLAMVLASGGGSKTPGPAASASATPEPKVQVVVAAKNIAAGVQITADMLTTSQEPQSKVTNLGDTFVDAASVNGRITATSVTKGQIIVGSRDLLIPGSMADGQSVSASVASGMLGVTVEVDQVNGVGTLIVPGDHVDIILSVYVPALGYDVKDTAGTQLKIDHGQGRHHQDGDPEPPRARARCFRLPARRRIRRPPACRCSCRPLRSSRTPDAT